LDYDIKYYYCNKHGERYISFNKEKNENLCDLCEYDKNNLFFYKIFKKNYEMIELKKLIDDLRKAMPNNTEELKEIIDNLEVYYNIENYLVSNYRIRHNNYYILKNINNINTYKESIIKDLNRIFNEDNLEKKSKYISEIYMKMNISNEIVLKYKIIPNIKNNMIKIFGKPFVNKNKNNYKLIIQDTTYELASFIKIIDINEKENRNLKKDEKLNDKEDEEDENSNEKDDEEEEEENSNEKEALIIKMKLNDILEIKLKQIKNATDISYMFSDTGQKPSMSKTKTVKLTVI